MFIAAQFTIAKYWKQPKCPSVDQKIMVHLHNGILCSRKKEGAPTLCMDQEGIMLFEISQAMKDIYHMISPISGT